MIYPHVIPISPLFLIIVVLVVLQERNCAQIFEMYFGIEGQSKSEVNDNNT